MKRDAAETAPKKSHAAVNAAWAASAHALAEWTMERMVNRTDAWGQYLPLDERAKGKAITRKGKLDLSIIIRHYQAKVVSDLIGLHSTSATNTSRWLGIDLDHHGTPNKERKLRNRAAAIAL